MQRVWWPMRFPLRLKSVFKTKLYVFWGYLKTREFSYWLTIATFLLVIVTFFLAIATKKMADVMLMDFKIRNLPIFRITTPKLETDDKNTIVTFNIANVSQGVAQRTIHNVIIEDKAGNLSTAQNIIVGRGKWIKRLNEIPIEYVPNRQEKIRLDWPKQNAPPEGLSSLAIVLTYNTLFDEKRRVHSAGFIYEFEHNNFDPMTEDILNKLLQAAREKSLIE